MGQFSVEKPALTGSVLNGNQQFEPSGRAPTRLGPHDHDFSKHVLRPINFFLHRRASRRPSSAFVSRPVGAPDGRPRARVPYAREASARPLR
jgi:hypothetical protein